MRGQPSRMPRSPITTTSGNFFETSTQSSGPMPAGSPEVRATTGLALVKPQVDVGLVAQLPQPFLEGLVRLALAQRLARLQPAPLGRDVARAPLEHLDQVIAELCAHRLAHLADAQPQVGALELGH